MKTDVWFIGAGPGDPELITLKGKRLIESADVIIYAGSLVNKKVLAGRKKAAVVWDSSGLTLEEVIAIIQEAVQQGRTVARVHTGDPSLYGAIREQADWLDQLGISYEVVPGVSSFTAAAAALAREFTLPGVSQTVICTRLAGRTSVPAKEQLKKLAAHSASMVIFLSIHMIRRVVDELLAGGYRRETKIAVVRKATWGDQQIVEGALEDIAGKVEKAGIKKTALILVGDFLDNAYEKSKLYDKNFSHGYRK